MDLLTQGIDALIISPVKPDAMGPIVDAAKKKNIPVVVDDIGGGGTNYDAIVISDNAKGGLQAADYLDSLIKAKAGAAKKVASITCDPTAVYAWQRNVNFEKRIKELGYTVVASLNGNSKQEEGYRLMKDILSANPDIAGIFSCNDPMAVGAAQAIADAGKQPSKDIFVVGFNADEIALKAIKEGTMNATIQQVPYEMGKMTVNLATQLMNGQALKYDNADLREIYVPVNLITADNVDTLLRHSPRPEAAATAALAPAQSAGKKKIGFSVYDMQYGFFQDMEKGTKEAAEAAGYDYVLVDQKIRIDHGGGHHGSAHPGHRCADHLARQA